MSTSGTIGQTVISTSKVLEHALRRAGVATSLQTPETVYIAQECLYLLLTHYSNDGLNLWCLEPKIIGYEAGRKHYTLPVGTTDVLNVMHARPTLVAQESLVANKVTLPAATTVTRVGIKFSALPTVDFTIDASIDDVVYTQQATSKVFELSDVGRIYWFDLNVAAPYKYITVSTGTVESMYICASVVEIAISPFNRDDYTALPNKDLPSATVTNYLFNKTLEPFITVWPVPTDIDAHLVVWVHRQVQDVGKLTQLLAIPQRWFEATIIQLAFRLSMELPGVDPARVTLLQSLSEKFKIEVGSKETDSAPITLQPNISVYTR